ncbi:MAG: hypothetical protein ACKPKO_20155, partial [Candidatus Fonsibacter sp.]
LVERRATTDLKTGKVLEDLTVDRSNPFDFHAIIPNGPLEIETTLHYRDSNPDKSTDAMFIHSCCESGSLLSRLVEIDRVKTIDITKEQDFTNARTVKYIIRNLRGPDDVFFYCLPCAGRVNVATSELGCSQQKGLATDSDKTT